MAEIEVMAIIDDEMKDDSVNSSLLESINSLSLSEDARSSNDLACCDSLLNNNRDASNTDWSSIKEVVAKIFSSQSSQIDSVAAGNYSQLGDPIIRDYVANLKIGCGSDEDEDLLNYDIGDAGSMEISDDEGNVTIENKRGSTRGKVCIQNVYRPNYNEDIVKVENNDTGMDHSLTTWGSRSSPEDLFKVWNLGISDEQDEFTRQLNKALRGFP